MKKIIFFIFSFLFIISLFGCTSDNIECDYDSVQDAINAQRSGVDLKGKTIRVDMNQDSIAGVIYYKADIDSKCNIYVTIITNDSNRSEVLNLKKDDIVVVKVDSFDNHLKYSFYIFATEYDVF